MFARKSILVILVLNKLGLLIASILLLERQIVAAKHKHSQNVTEWQPLHNLFIFLLVGRVETGLVEEGAPVVLS